MKNIAAEKIASERHWSTLPARMTWPSYYLNPVGHTNNHVTQTYILHSPYLHTDFIIYIGASKPLQKQPSFVYITPVFLKIQTMKPKTQRITKRMEPKTRKAEI